MTVRYAKRGRTRVVPLDADALKAFAVWVKARPVAATKHLLLSLPRAGEPRPLTTRDIARIVARHPDAAGLPDDRRSPHVLRHIFCTHLADAGVDTAVLRELAGHADIRTTTVYTPSTPAGSKTPSLNATNAAAGCTGSAASSGGAVQVDREGL